MKKAYAESTIRKKARELHYEQCGCSRPITKHWIDLARRKLGDRAYPDIWGDGSAHEIPNK